MEKSNIKNKYGLFATICFVLCAVFYVIDSAIGFVIKYGFDILSIVDLDTLITPLKFLDYITILTYIAFAVTIFLRKPKAIVIVAVVNTLLQIHLFAVELNYNNGYLSASNLFNIICGGLLVFMFVSTIKENTIVEKIWFIPGFALLATNILFLIIMKSDNEMTVKDVVLYFNFNVFTKNIEAIAIIFVGLWLKNFEFKNISKPNYAVGSMVKQVPINNIGNEADELISLKELLDSDVISKEEYETKKNQILKL